MIFKFVTCNVTRLYNIFIGITIFRDYYTINININILIDEFYSFKF